jgi:membrane-bound lytic murein transglycosylase MltF
LFKTLTVVTVAVLLAMASASPGVAMPVDDLAVVQSGDLGDGFEVQLFDLAAVRRVFQALARQRAAMTEGKRVAAWADVSLMTEAITGEPAVGFPLFDDVERAVKSGVGPRVRAIRDRQNAPPVTVQRASFGPFDDLIERYASMHAVESALVRAIIQVESAFNPRARSHVGAIGLMQLMPGTARELGVDPFVPEQNIEGGVRYFSQQLKTFGAVDLALVAYNAGPGFAERYLRGQAALYGETREYVTNVLARLSALR